MKTSLKLHRLQRGMKQSDLADLVNVRRETIGRLEQGQYCPSLRLAMDLARVFGTTVEDLFSFDDEYESESEWPVGVSQKKISLLFTMHVSPITAIVGIATFSERQETPPQR